LDGFGSYPLTLSRSTIFLFYARQPT
jgi:hypothetical protein